MRRCTIKRKKEKHIFPQAVHDNGKDGMYLSIAEDNTPAHKSSPFLLSSSKSKRILESENNYCTIIALKWYQSDTLTMRRSTRLVTYVIYDLQDENQTIKNLNRAGCVEII